MVDFAFMHGGGQGGWVWDETISALASQAGAGTHRTLALDAPGCGAKRSRDTSAVTFAAIVEELVADIESAGFGDVVLVGHSQAGTVMPAMRALRPGLFRKLVFVSCTAPDPGLNTVEMTADRLHPGSHPFTDTSLTERERYARMFCNDMTTAGREAFLDKLGKDQWPVSSYRENGWAYDHLAQVPVSYVLCRQDAILPLEWQEFFAKRCHANTTPMIDAGHQVMNTRPHALAEVLLAELHG